MIDHPFYFTWSKQRDPVHYSLDSVKEHSFISDKKELLDFSSISYQASFGLKPKFVIDALKEQMDLFTIAAPKAVHPLKETVSKKLIDLIDLNGGKIFYTTSGAESVENALKIARLYTGKKTILARRPSYHGGTLGAVSVTGDWRNKAVPTLDAWTKRIPEPEEDLNFSKTLKMIEDSSDLAAVILETVPGNNGVLIPEKAWLKKIQKACNENNVLLILDEVICGFYRLGTPFGYQSFGLSPDIITMAKAMTAGVIPFGAVWTSDKIHSHFKDIVLSCGLTNYAHPLGLKALEAVLSYTEQKSFKDHLRELISKIETDIKSLKLNSRTIGALVAIDLDSPPTHKEFFDGGISLIAQETRIILAPHLNLPIDDWSRGFKILERLLDQNI